jgi:hypothetical protein
VRLEDGEELRESLETCRSKPFERVRSDEVDLEVDMFGIEEEEDEAPVAMKVGWAGELEFREDDIDPGVGGVSPGPPSFAVRCRALPFL